MFFVAIYDDGELEDWREWSFGMSARNWRGSLVRLALATIEAESTARGKSSDAKLDITTENLAQSLDGLLRNMLASAATST